MGNGEKNTAAVCWRIDEDIVRVVKYLAAEMGVGFRPGQVVSMLVRIFGLWRDPDKSLRESVKEAIKPFLNLPPRILWAIGKCLFYAGQLCQKAAVERDPTVKNQEEDKL